MTFRRFAGIRRPAAAGGAFLVVLAATCVAAPASALAAAAPVPPTITSSFTPTAVPLGLTSALSITITNPNASIALTGVSFSDTLPTGLVVDNPNGSSGSCGSSTGLVANPGSNSISLAGGTLAKGASCTVSADVTTNTAGTYTDLTGPASATQTAAKPYAIAGTGNGSSATLTVIGNPTITISSPKNKATFNYGQKVKAKFTCAEAPGGPGLSSCSGSDVNGNNVNSGGALPTKTAGQNSLTVTAISTDGAIITDTVNYKVRPDNKLTDVKATGTSGGTITVTGKAPGPGKIKAVVTVAGISGTFSTKTVKQGSKGKLKLKLSPSAAQATALQALTGTVKATVKLTYTPKGGKAGTITKKGVKV
jgi:Domain of unknown function DUF11